MAERNGDTITPSVEYPSSACNPTFRPEDPTTVDNSIDSDATEALSVFQSHAVDDLSHNADPSSVTVAEDSPVVGDTGPPLLEESNVASSFDAERPTVFNAAGSNYRTDENHVSNTVDLMRQRDDGEVPLFGDENGQLAHTAMLSSTDSNFAPANAEDTNHAVPHVEADFNSTEAHPSSHQSESHSSLPVENGGLQPLNLGVSIPQTEEDVNHPTTNGDGGNTTQAVWGYATDTRGADDEDEFFNQLNTQTKPIYSPPDPDARFEEGMPLLDGAVQSPQSTAQPDTNIASKIDEIFNEDGDSDDAFFSSIQNSASREDEPSQITRKSTSQVVGDLGLGPDSPASETAPTSLQTDGNETAPIPKNVQNQEPSEEELAARWQAELDDDDDILLGDEAGETSIANQAPVSQDPNEHSNSNVATNGLGRPFESPPRKQPISYAAHQPSTSGFIQGVSLDEVSPASTAPAPSYFVPQSKTTPAVGKAESFVERSKEGYKSPYDLPEDLTLPRRPHKPAAPKVTGIPLPARNNSVPIPPPMSASPSLSTSAPPPASVPPPKNFFEELPPPPRPRPASRPTSSGRYTPDTNGSIPGLYRPPPPSTVNKYNSAPPPPPPAGSGRYTPDRKASIPASPSAFNQYTSSPSPSQLSGESYFQPQLQKSEKTDPYANLLSPSAPSVPSAASRYSPKPPGLQAGSKPPSSRYSPVPPPPSSAAAPNLYTPPPSSTSGPTGPLPFQPRTSSPLAYHEDAKYQMQPPQAPLSEPAGNISPPRSVPQPPASQSSFQAPSFSIDSFDPEGTETTRGEMIHPLVGQQQIPPPRNPYAPQAYANDISARGRSVPDSQQTLTASVFPTNTPLVNGTPFSPPRRSRTQSPSQQRSIPRLSVPSIDPLQRPASAGGPGSPIKNSSPYSSAGVTKHTRVPSQHLEFIPPEEDQRFDPLERWKGSPIVNFGFGGDVVSCFPRHVPRFTSGQTAPKLKSTPGEVKIHQLNKWIPIAENIIQHPGPLKSKSKKKDVLAWLSSKIAAFENEKISELAQSHSEPYKRLDDKILLWKIVKILVENDGKLEGSAEIQKSVRNVIFPDLQNSEAGQAYGDRLTASAEFQSPDAHTQPGSVGPHFVEMLRTSLLNGEREKAVWSAVDNRLWGHAMIIASTLDRSVWKQVVQEFVRREMRSKSRNIESLAALYEIFVGNIEESVDELVPPSVRAGLQMVSKDNAQGPTRNALDGLDSWRDTLQLVLSNHSPNDSDALVALGRLLSNYGRTEAAHICYIFSRAPVFGGVDDPQSSIVLLGADHKRFSNALLDEDSILLTEVYEYAISVLAGSHTSTLPHLLAFKLVYAKTLAERGRKLEALQYCDAIASTLKAVTKPSAYYNHHLFSEIDELSTRLRQTTSDGISSWISRPSMEKVSGSMWAKFSSFVAGEDSDAVSTGSGKAGEPADVGPFAKLTGTPTISRSPSLSDMYGSFPGPGAQPIPAGVSSRYHPGSQYAANGSPDHYRPRSSLDSQRSNGSFGLAFGQRRGSQEPPTTIEGNPYHPGSLYNSPQAAGHHFTPPQTSYVPLEPVDEDHPYRTKTGPTSVPPTVPSVHGADSFGRGPGVQKPANAFQPGPYSYMSSTSTSGYEPPSNSFDATETADASAVETREEKSSMDEDDGSAARAAAARKAEQEQADREADEAFKKAAEADAQKAQPAKKSWFSGWFGSKKDNANNNSGGGGGGGPIRAKLGEANSFYYDKDLKKWVNKKDPDSGNSVRGTPPPPKGPAPSTRSASPNMPPMVSGPPPTQPASILGGPPSVSGSPAPPSSSASPLLASSAPGSTLAPPGATTGGPPQSRPPSSLSHATSIDDLLGAPQARKGPPSKGKKKGRYVDVMAK